MRYHKVLALTTRMRLKMQALMDIQKRSRLYGNAELRQHACWTALS